MFFYKANGDYNIIENNTIIENFVVTRKPIVRKPIVKKPIVRKPILSTPVSSAPVSSTNVTTQLQNLTISNIVLSNVANINQPVTSNQQQTTTIATALTPKTLACIKNTKYTSDYLPNNPYQVNASSELVMKSTQSEEHINVLVLPKGIIDLKNTIYQINNIHHGYEITLKNTQNNIYINNLQYNFTTIINTSQLKPDGTIRLSNINKRQKLVLIQNLLKHMVKTYDILGNMCNDNYNNSQEIFDKYINYNNASTQPIINNNIINYYGNPNIFIFTDVRPCTLQYVGDEIKDNNSIYIYLDYDKIETTETNKIATNYLSLKRIILPKGLITTNNTDNIINPFYNGFENIIDCKNNRNFVFNLYPEDLLNGFASIITTKNTSCKNINSNIGIIKISQEVLTKLKTRALCIKYNLYIAVIDLNNEKNYIDETRVNGPYTSLSFTGNPKIIIYIKPYNQQDNIDIYINFVY
jgi:hypothetical protein